ncbi:MAG: hypothetical protein Q8935_00775 [Bacillota bacterium]|nr:hypothetical protein [Bacillota bacterium]
MKVNYPIKNAFEMKVIKEELKPFGGRCAKVVDGILEYQIKDENKDAAYEHLKDKGIIS